MVCVVVFCCSGQHARPLMAGVPYCNHIGPDDVQISTTTASDETCKLMQNSSASDETCARFFSFIINGCMRRRTYSHALKNTQPRFELAHRLTPSAGGARLRTRGFEPRFYPAFANKPTDTTNKPPRKVQPYATVYKYVRPPASRVPLLPIGTAPTAQRLRCSFPYATVQLPFSLRLLPTNQQATTQGATVCNRI